MGELQHYERKLFKDSSKRPMGWNCDVVDPTSGETMKDMVTMVVPPTPK
jgi:hypothetical protein